MLLLAEHIYLRIKLRVIIDIHLTKSDIISILFIYQLGNKIHNIFSKILNFLHKSLLEQYPDASFRFHQTVCTNKNAQTKCSYTIFLHKSVLKQDSEKYTTFC